MSALVHRPTEGAALFTHAVARATGEKRGQ